MSDSNNNSSEEIKNEETEQTQTTPEQENPFAMNDVKRRRAEQLYEHAVVQSNQKKYDYAADLLIQSIAIDPGNMTYVQAYLDTLRKKWNNNKKGDPFAFFKIGTPRKAAKKDPIEALRSE